MADAIPAYVLHSEAARTAVKNEAQTIPGKETDEELMVAFARGRTAAFSTLFERYRQPLFGFFRRRMDDAALAEELAQETFLAVLRGAARYEPTALFRTWLYAIAFKMLTAHRRKAAFRASFMGSAPEGHEPADASSQDIGFLIRDAVGKLERLDREVLMLREFEQLSYAEIAEVLGLRLNTVRSRLFRARMALHELLGGRSLDTSNTHLADAAQGKDRI